MRRRVLVLLAVALVAPVQAARADIGIVGVTPSQARRGDRVRVTAAGYLGMTHQTFRVVLVPASRAPRPYSCMHGTTFCEPSFLLPALDRPPFRVIGSIKRWRRIGPRGAQQGRASLVFRLPTVGPGRYVFGLFCPSCIRSPRGSLIVAYDLILRVAR